VTSEYNKRLTRRALDEINANGDLELADELVHPEFMDHEPGHGEQPTGPESVKHTVRHLHSGSSGYCSSARSPRQASPRSARPDRAQAHGRSPNRL
jgi:hypothetical protein